MQRTDWQFDYTAAKLGEAAQAKIDWHTERLEWWKTKKDQIFATISVRKGWRSMKKYQWALQS